MKKSGQWLFFVLVVAAMTLSGFAPGMSAPAEQARVWVEFAPGRSGEVRASLAAVGAEFHYTFDELSSFVVSVPQNALQGLARNPNIVGIEDDVPRYPMGDTTLNGQTIPYGLDKVQARDIWDANRDGVVDPGAPTGAGRTVCIIDSGLYQAHEDFAGMNVIGGYSQVGTPWNTDGNGHGTHVAGTINAANNSLGVVGVSPGAISLFIVKVFNDNGAWTLSSDLIDAVSRCRNAEANVINMSLGGGRPNAREERAFNNAYAAGVLSIAAAGNDGSTALNYPASYSSVVSVAATDVNNQVADFSQKNAAVELAAPGVSVLSTVPFLAINRLTVDGATYEGGQIEFAALGTATGNLANGGLCNSTGAWSGLVVLCQRGDISFFDKVRNVQNSGGVAAVIYNNVPGGFLGTLGEGNSSTIPAISLSQEDGQFLVANKVSRSGTVQSTLTKPASGYEAWDGTSMATPHVSAVAALVWSANTSWTNEQIRTALQQNALDLGASGRDNASGFGLVQARAALDALTGGGGGGGGGGDEGALSVSVSTNKAEYIKGETVSITVLVTEGSTAVSGASVQLQIAVPKGSTYSGSGTTNANGIATFSFKINPNKDGVGVYTVTANASKSGYTNGEGSTQFTVR
jgi:serine protease